MLKVGLTSSIACGKTQTLKEFCKLGVHTIDADQIAHQVIRRGNPGYQKMVKEFGDSILRKDGSIDRGKLSRIVFSDQERLRKLNRIVHPYILEEEQRRISELERRSDDQQPQIVMVDAALMVETGSYRRYDCVVGVYCPSNTQLQRLILRDQISQAEALRKIRSQMPVKEKMKHIDYVIDNSGSLDDTRRQVKNTLTKLLEHRQKSKQRSLSG